MRRIDRYWKRCAAGMMAALTLMLGQGTMQSFAMNAQVVTSPNKIIVQDETQNTDDQNNNRTQNVVSKAEVAGFGEVNPEKAYLVNAFAGRPIASRSML